MVPYKPIHHHPPQARMTARVALPSSTELEPPPYVESPNTASFACISLHKTDRLRLIQLPPEDIAAIRTVIKEYWPSGIQEDGRYGLSHEFKCHGNPWAAQGVDAIRAHVLMRAILASLFERGWVLTASTDVSKVVTEKDTLVFRKQATPPPQSEWVALSFDQGDRLRLIGSPPMDLIEAFRRLLMTMDLLQQASWRDEALGCFEFKLHGWPWRPQGEQTVMARMLLLRMLETLESEGWSLYTTVGQNGGTHKNAVSTGTDSWYCVRAVDWVPGNSVFQR